MFEGLMLF